MTQVRTRSAVLLVLLGSVVWNGLVPADAFLDPASPWVAGPVVDGLPDGQGRHFRIAVDVSFDGEAMTGRQFVPVTMVLDIAQALQEAGYPALPDGGGLQGFHLDLDSFLVAHVDESGNAVDGGFPIPSLATPVSVQDQVFHPQRAPTVLLRWIMPEAVQAGSEGIQHFHVYFDSLENGKKSPPAVTDEAMNRLLEAIGPGRGTDLYVATFPLAQPQGASEPRSLRITALGGPTRVEIREYTAFGVPSDRMVTLTIPGAGQTATYRFGDGGDRTSEGLLFLHADGLIAAEAIHQGVSSPIFLPSSDGGYIGTRFDATPVGDQWAIVCPAETLPSGTCQVTVDQGAPRTYSIGRNQAKAVPVTPGVPAVLTSQAGSVMVQRHNQETGFVSWPPKDGPVLASQSIGMVQATQGDRFIIHPLDGATTVRLQSLEGSRPVLSDALSVPITGASGYWNARKGWPDSDQIDGAVLLQSNNGQGVRMLNGDLDDSGSFGGLIPLASSDGGYTYRALVPKNSGGQAMGSLHVFTPIAGTHVQATRWSETEVVSIPSLTPSQAHQHMQFDGAGLWTIRADLPILASWVKPSVNGFSGLASGWTTAASATVVGSQYAGFAFDARARNPIVLAQPGDQIEFTIDITNLARTVASIPLHDDITVQVQEPSGWKNVFAAPGFLSLDGSSSASTVVRAVVPGNPGPSSTGETLHAIVQSTGNPLMRVDVPLRVNYIVHREVLLTADGHATTSVREIKPGETAVYDLRVLNRGSIADQFDIDRTSGNSQWDVRMVCGACPEGRTDRTPLLAPGESIQMLMEVMTKSTSDTVSRLNTFVQATSTTDPSATDSVQTSTLVGAERSFVALVDKPSQIGLPGQTMSFVVDLANDSDFNEDLLVERVPSQDPDWQAATVTWVGVGDLKDQDPPNRVTMAPHGAARLEIRLRVPGDAVAHALHLERLRLTSQFQPDGTGHDVDLRTFVGLRSNVTVALSPPEVFVRPGDPFSLRLEVDVESNGEQPLRVEARDPEWDVGVEGLGSGPWTLDTASGRTTTMDLHGTVPFTTPPAGRQPSWVAFIVSGTGVPDQVVLAHLVVEESSSATLTAPPTVLAPGAMNRVSIDVVNGGNVPLEGRLTILVPEGWSAPEVPVDLPVGGQALLAASILVPTDAVSISEPLDVRLLGPASTPIAQTRLTVSVADPTLHVAPDGSSRLGDTHSVLRFKIENTGQAPASNVALFLVHDGKELDRVLVHQVLPGEVQRVTLIGPVGRGTEAWMTADHLPEMVRIAMADPSSNSTPGVSGATILLVFLALALVRRRHP